MKVKEEFPQGIKWEGGDPNRTCNRREMKNTQA